MLQLLDSLRVPVDSQAERDLRMVKQHKISGCWRTLAGAPAFPTVRSHVSTTRNHEVDPLHASASFQQGSPLASSPSRPPEQLRRLNASLSP